MRDQMVRRDASAGHDIAGRVLRSGICLGVIACAGFAMPAAAESLPDALVKAYQTNPQLNGERAHQRSTDENVPQALAGYRPIAEIMFGDFLALCFDQILNHIAKYEPMYDGNATCPVSR